jgi:hypothetical protein
VTGWCAAENGDLNRGVVLLTEAITALKVTQSRQFKSYLLGLLADVHMKAERPADAMKAVEDGIALTEAGGERFYSAELHRLHGAWRNVGSSAIRPETLGRGVVPRRHRGCQAARSCGVGVQGKCQYAPLVVISCGP